MNDRIKTHKLTVATPLFDFINKEVLPDLHIKSDDFWAGFSSIVKELSPVNIHLLKERERLQHDLDVWHESHPGPITDMRAYQTHLKEIGYLVDPPANVHVKTKHVDDELAHQAGPQLVVPILNARYALNAANARWGSLYDALYGTDVIAEDNGC